MGASGSRHANSAQQLPNTPLDQFVLIVTAPAGVGKEELMGTFISENVKRVAYVAKIGAVRATKPGLLYFYESIADPEAPPTRVDSYSTILQAMQAGLRDGKSVVVDVDVAGARALRESDVPGCYVFVLPESMEILRENITQALDGELPDEIERTVVASKKEILAVDEPDLFDYGVQNDKDSAALEQLATLADTHGRVAPAVLKISSAQTLPPESPANLPPASDHGSLDRGTAFPSIAKSVPHLDSSPPDVNTSATSDSAEHKPGGTVNVVDRSGGAHSAAVGGLVILPGMERLRGEIAVVTGASSGIGWAVCEALVAAGMRVVGAARRKERLQALQSHMLKAGAGGRMFLPVMCDVTQEDEVRTLISIAVKTFEGRPVSVLVNAAGVRAREGGNLMQGSSKAWVEMMSTNVLATGMCCREACISMQRARQWGHIVILGAQGGAHDAGDTFFQVSKQAVKSIANGLRIEARESGVPLRVSLISPGLVDTEATRARLGNHHPLPELSTLDVANTILYILAQPAHVDVSDVTVMPNDILE